MGQLPSLLTASTCFWITILRPSIEHCNVDVAARASPLAWQAAHPVVICDPCARIFERRHPPDLHLEPESLIKQFGAWIGRSDIEYRTTVPNGILTVEEIAMKPAPMPCPRNSSRTPTWPR
jgi:hypothetical protein